MSKVLIIGGGAAGMMAAVAAGENGHEVWLYEKNDRLGRKLFITGKGRCNITNAGDMETLFASVMSNPKFLYSSFYTFTNDQVIDFFEELGVRTKIERGNRVFPLSDHSSDVIAGLKRKLETLGPMEVREWYAKELQGLSLRNVSAAVYDGKKKLYEDFGEMLFTHYGVSGPLMLSASSVIGKRLSEKELRLVIDLKPALTAEQLDARVLREFEEHKNKQFKNAVDHLFPSKLKPVMLELSGISEEKKVNEISREERQRFVHLIKHFEMTLSGLRSYKEAIITKGGVNVKEIDPGTMESKKISGLYFVGEVLDLDALTGGFNLQIAWSTAYLAGISIP